MGHLEAPARHRPDDGGNLARFHGQRLDVNDRILVDGLLKVVELDHT